MGGEWGLKCWKLRGGEGHRFFFYHICFYHILQIPENFIICFLSYFSSPKFFIIFKFYHIIKFLKIVIIFFYHIFRIISYFYFEARVFWWKNSTYVLPLEEPWIFWTIFEKMLIWISKIRKWKKYHEKNLSECDLQTPLLHQRQNLAC